MFNKMSEFIKINNKIFNIKYIKAIIYSEEDEELSLENCEGDYVYFLGYVPFDKSSFILGNLHEALTKNENYFDFYFKRPTEE
jgi:hypothetical protein